MKSARVNVMMQLGEYCTNHLCKEGKCEILRIIKETGNETNMCCEALRFPEVAFKVSQFLKQEG